MEDLVKVYEQKSEAVRSKLAKRHTASSQDAKESGTIHGTWQFENMMLSYIRDGEVEKLRAFLSETEGSKRLENTAEINGKGGLR